VNFHCPLYRSGNKASPPKKTVPVKRKNGHRKRHANLMPKENLFCILITHVCLSIVHFTREKRYALSLYIQKHQIRPSGNVLMSQNSFHGAYLIPSSIPWLFRSGNVQCSSCTYSSRFSILPYVVGTYLYGVSRLADMLVTSQPLHGLGGPLS
jgi:hypothetical protein